VNCSKDANATKFEETGSIFTDTRDKRTLSLEIIHKKVYFHFKIAKIRNKVFFLYDREV
jgi:hypothetical protein